MNKIEVVGTLKDGGKNYKQGHLYLLDVPRKSGVIDTLMVFPKDGVQLSEGPIRIVGRIQSQYIKTIGVPVYIIPEDVEPRDVVEVSSDATATGTLKEDPVCRKTKTDKNICTLLLITDDGTVPVLLWGDLAKEAPNKFKAGDRLTARGRLQSREYPDKNGGKRQTWELSARKIKFARED